MSQGFQRCLLDSQCHSGRIGQLLLLRPACITYLFWCPTRNLHCADNNQSSISYKSCTACTLIVSGCSSSILTIVSLLAYFLHSSSSSSKSSVGLPAAMTVVFPSARTCRDSKLQTARRRAHPLAQPAVFTWVAHSRPMPLLAPVTSQVVLDIRLHRHCTGGKLTDT